MGAGPAPLRVNELAPRSVFGVGGPSLIALHPRWRDLNGMLSLQRTDVILSCFLGKKNLCLAVVLYSSYCFKLEKVKLCEVPDW